MSVIKSRWYSLKSIWSRNGAYEKKALLLIFLSVVFIYICYSVVVEDSEDFQKGYSEATPYDIENQKYLISTSKCRIPDIDPFNDEVKKFIVKEKYTKCTKLGLLTYIDKTDGVAVLKVNASLLPLYSSLQITCCYSNISRINYVNKSDNEITYTPCAEFKDEITISYPYIKVTCTTSTGKIYSNTHAIILPKEPNKTDINIDTRNRYSVLLVGIDSMSKQNLLRTMPKTYEYLENNFIGLKGYNKVGENTFPNLMAILTGQSLEQLKDNCNRTVKINNCDIIWKSFKDLGYVTAYAEDESTITTFNYNRFGFLDPPTDFYGRPYILASEELGVKMIYNMNFCTGPEVSSERILNLAKDFSVSFKDVPSFGLFWINSFSHDNFNMPLVMDNKVLEFLSDTAFEVSLNHTIMMFFSDHGFRFGDIRYTHSGWLEERLPFIYFHIPNSFREAFPDRYRNFLINTKRLTTPYDVFATFQEVLEIGNDTYMAKNSLGCPHCHSLFEEVAESRTCKEAAIDQHWCTCTGHNYVNPKNKLVTSVAEFVITEVNSYIRAFPRSLNCANYALQKVITAGMSQTYLNDKNDTVRYFLVMIETKPNARFEATVEASLERNAYKLLGDISRINRYAEDSGCVENDDLKKFCYCDGLSGVIKRFLF